MVRQSSILRSGFLAVLLASTSFTAAAAGPAAPRSGSSPAHRASIAANYGRLPLSFEANQGQADAQVKFLSHGGGYQLSLAGNEAMLVLSRPVADESQPGQPRDLLRKQGTTVADVVRMQVAGARTGTQPDGEDRLPGTVNYFIGSDPAKWRTNIPTYAKVRYPGIYPGIDLVYYGNQQQLEYDFAVAPGADPIAIRLRFGGAKALHRAAGGDLVVDTADGRLTFRKPTIYQTIGGYRIPVAGEFALRGERTVGFRLGRYDREKPLLIDPVLEYSTFLGGSGSAEANAIAVDGSGNAYISGVAWTEFPVTAGAFQTADNGAANQVSNAFVAKLNPTGTALVYSTYLGGSGSESCGGDSASGLAVDSAGNAYVTGSTCSTNFPVTQGVFQTTNEAAANQVATAFVTELNPAGAALIYSSYLGGSGSPLCPTNCSGPYGGDAGIAIAVDTTGDAYVAGKTYSTDFPVTQGAFQGTNSGAAKEDPNGFVVKLNPTGTALIYSTYLGGSGWDTASALAVDGSGDAYVTGSASSTNFPVTTGAFQSTNKAAAEEGANVFVSELNPAGTALVYSTYLGGSYGDSGSAIAVDAAGNIYVAGAASSPDFPVTQGAFQTTNHFTFSDEDGPNAFVTKLNPAGTSLVYSTYLGGSGGVVNVSPVLPLGFLGGDAAAGLAVDSAGDAYLTGSTASANFPVTQDAYQPINQDQPGCTGGCFGGYNAFITELNPAGSALVYSTFLGGDGGFGEGDQAKALALDGSGSVYVTGIATSGDFPVTSGAFQLSLQSTQNAFVAKFGIGTGSTTTVSPAISITQAPNPATSAQPITVTVVASGPSGSPTPTGTVTVSTGGYGPVPATLSGGSATFDIPGGTLPASECYPTIPKNSVAVNYIPDAASSSQYNFTSATGGIYVAGPCIEITPNFMVLTPAQAESLSFLFVVTSSSNAGLPLPTGTVTISGSYNSPALPLVNNSASITVPTGTFQTGNNNLWLSYSGDSNYAAMSSFTDALIDVTSSTPYGFSITGTPVTIQPGATTGNTSTITVTPAGTFAGVVNLTCAVLITPPNPASPITCSIPASVNVTGSAGASTSMTVSSTASTTPGDYVIAVNGFGNAPDTAVVNVTVTAPPQQPVFALSNSGNITLNAGATTGNTATITVTPSGGFTGSVALTAAITSEPAGAVNPPTLSFGSTSPVSITGAAAGTATLTIATTANRSGCTAASDKHRAAPWFAGGAALACLLLFGIPARRRAWRRMLGMVVLLAAILGGVMACNSTQQETGCPDLSFAGTTAGTYTITVTGTSGTTTSTGTLTLTVQ